MATQVRRKPGAAFEQYVKKRFPDGPSRARFDREVAAIQAVAQMVSALETSRSSMALTKSELANRAGLKDAAVSRLLASPGSNPTLKTWIGLLQALGLQAEVRLYPRRKDSRRLIEVNGV